ncbi:replication initiator protein A [Aerococcaceae bacterium NML191292]|nr:replication initiator protein A [Aerococcaceae bacterium NML191292]
MELLNEQDYFNLPVVMFEDVKFQSLSLSAKVLYAVLTDRGTRDNGVIRIEDIDEKEIQRFVSFNDKMYRLAKEQLKLANLLVEVITKGNITFQLQVVEGSV